MGQGRSQVDLTLFKTFLWMDRKTRKPIHAHARLQLVWPDLKIDS